MNALVLENKGERTESAPRERLCAAVCDSFIEGKATPRKVFCSEIQRFARDESIAG